LEPSSGLAREKKTTEEQAISKKGRKVQQVTKITQKVQEIRRTAIAVGGGRRTHGSVNEKRQGRQTGRDEGHETGITAEEGRRKTKGRGRYR